MKRLIALLFVAVPLCAYEIPGNPDRLPSIGFTQSGASSHGTATFGLFPYAPMTAGTDHNVSQTTVDIRLPITEFLTLNASYGGITENFSVDQPSAGYGIAGVSQGLHGNTYSVGARMYFRVGHYGE